MKGSRRPPWWAVLVLAACLAEVAAVVIYVVVRDPTSQQVVVAQPAGTTAAPTSTTIAATATSEAPTVPPVTLPVPTFPPPSTTPPLVFRFTDDATLAQALNAEARVLIGRDLNDPAFVVYFHGLERQQQTQAQRGQSYYVPDPIADAAAWINTNYPTEVGALRADQAYKAMMCAISKSLCPPG